MLDALSSHHAGDEVSARLLALIADPASRPNPYPLYEKLRERPVWRGADCTYVIGRYEDVSNLIRDPRLSADPTNSAQGGAALSFLNMDPPEHDRLRRMTMRHFGPPNNAGRVEAMTPALKAMLAVLIDRLIGRSEIDVVADISYAFPGRVIADLLSVPREDEPKFSAWAEAIAQATDRDAGRRSEAAERAFHDLAGYMLGLIAARRGSSRDDLLSRLVNDDGPDGSMRPDEIIRVSILLLLAGHETTVNLISNGMLTLLRFPQVLDQLRDEPALAPSIVEELLRYDPPVHTIYRGTLCDLEVGGILIPGGSSVQLMLASANRDPRRFEDADTFKPGRQNNQHLGFGGGIHACFGAPLARLEGQIALSELARRLVSPRLLQDPPPYRFNPTLRGPRELRVAIERVVE
jgi:cytochrome P450